MGKIPLKPSNSTSTNRLKVTKRKKDVKKKIRRGTNCRSSTELARLLLNLCMPKKQHQLQLRRNSRVRE